VKRRRIAVNSVINCSFFYYICCFSIFPSSFIDSGSGVTILCNQFRMRRLDTWRHRVRDHSTRHRPLTTYSRSFGTKTTYGRFQDNGQVKILTFQGHVTSSVTWTFDSQIDISYRCCIVAKSLSPAVFEIMDTKHIVVVRRRNLARRRVLAGGHVQDMCWLLCL